MFVNKGKMKMDDEKKYRYLIEKYSAPGSFYTSYPTLQNWSQNIDNDTYKEWLKKSSEKNGNFEFLLYLHIPFCPKLCYYCCCNKIISTDYNKVKEFLDYIFIEIDLLSEMFKKSGLNPIIKEIHFGGGSPSYLKFEDFSSLVNKIRSKFDLSSLKEFLLEVDVRNINKDQLIAYSGLGINRISCGIQDFDPEVQKAVNREQSVTYVRQLIDEETSSKFKSVNFDLIYGLPLQTRDTFKDTIKKALTLSPGRICVYNYDHRPEVYNNQTAIKILDLPVLSDKMMMFIDALNILSENNYEYIGIDHFAKKDEELSLAKYNGKLTRYFNGYGVGTTNNFIGIGPTSLSSFGNYYVKSKGTLKEYYNDISKGVLPITKGSELQFDDLIRREVIFKLICDNKINFSDFNTKFNNKFEDYFKEELNRLSDLKNDGFIISSNEGLTVTDIGRLFVRHICSVFDNYNKIKLPTS